MTDKEQIIINGVDVSKCDKLIVNQLYGYACNCEEDTHIISSCKNRHNCYYKQLARKTQECEELHTELKFKVEYIQEQREVIKDLEKKLKISIQALEELEMTENNFNFTNQDEYFKGLDTELAKKSIRLTIENRKLENKLSDIAGICEQILDGEDYVRRIAKTILDIID
jgi:hypothetical protein